MVGRKISELPEGKLTEKDKVVGIILQTPEVRKVTITGSYRVENVLSDSDHPMSSYVEDEEDMYVYSEFNDMYYPASEFFNMVEFDRFVSL